MVFIPTSQPHFATRKPTNYVQLDGCAPVTLLKKLDLFSWAAALGHIYSDVCFKALLEQILGILF